MLCISTFVVTAIRILKSGQPWVNCKQVTIEQVEETKHLFQIILNSK